MISEEELKNMSQEQIAELQKQNCIFCKINNKEIPSKIVYEDDICSAILDINPANEGHTLIIPKEHYQIMPQVPQDMLGHMFVAAKKMSKALLMSTLAKSTNIFVANGAVAGQKAPHFMIHVIPRIMESEFFNLPSNQAKPEELEKVKEALASKLSQISGASSVQEQIVQKPELPQFEEIQSSENPIANKPELKEEEPKVIEELKDPKKVVKTGIKKERGYLYYIDKEGDVARAPMKWKKDIKNKQEDETKDENADLDKISDIFLGGKK